MKWTGKPNALARQEGQRASCGIQTHLYPGWSLAPFIGVYCSGLNFDENVPGLLAGWDFQSGINCSNSSYVLLLGYLCADVGTHLLYLISPESRGFLQVPFSHHFSWGDVRRIINWYTNLCYCRNFTQYKSSSLSLKTSHGIQHNSLF